MGVGKGWRAMSWTLAQVKKGGWKSDARFVEVAAFDDAEDKEHAARHERDEAVALLRALAYQCDCNWGHEDALDDAHGFANDFLSRLDAAKGGRK